jgi:hypothetical protein
MCGVAGELRFDGERADVGLLDRMTGCLRHLRPTGQSPVNYETAALTREVA